MERKNLFVDGFSISVWKSLVVKSVRIGWLDGLLAAESRLPKSQFQNLMVAGLFEDVFPAGYGELNEAAKEIKNRDYLAFLSRQTHHSRPGLTQKFYDIRNEAIERGKVEGGRISAIVRNSAPEIMFIVPRVYNCLYSWYYIMPSDKEQKRDVFRMPFTGMPRSIMDGHTYEGKKYGIDGTFLSGSYQNHLKLANEVLKNGWNNGLRQQLENDEIMKLKQQSLF